MKSIPITALACLGGFTLVMLVAVAIRHYTGWTDPKGFFVMLGAVFAFAIYHEARS